jgi:hypothetical protein
MKVYMVVETRFYEGSCNLAVFSSESEAKNFVRDIMGDDIELIYDIEEWDLDDRGIRGGSSISEIARHPYYNGRSYIHGPPMED